MTSRLSMRRVRGSCEPCQKRACNSSLAVSTSSICFNRGVKDETTKESDRVAQIYNQHRQSRSCDCFWLQPLGKRRHDPCRCREEEGPSSVRKAVGRSNRSFLIRSEEHTSEL